MKRLVWIPTLAVLTLAACESNPTLTDPRTQELTAELADVGHAHTLGDVTFTVTVRNGLGHVVSDFESVVLQRRAGADPWRDITLERQGQSWMATYSFGNSGEYHLRVMATRPGVTEPLEIPFHDHEMAELHVGRAHVEIEGVRFEFESFPGHVHEGDEVVSRFWVMEAEPDASGVRQPLAGFQGTIACSDPGGFVEEHDPHEIEPGVYEATHTWTEAGDAKAFFRFDSPDGHSHEATFEFHVVHGH